MSEGKLNKTKLSSLHNNFEMLVGGACLVIALTVVARNFLGLTEDLFASNMVMMINLVIGLFLLNAGVRRYRFMKKYNRYVDILNNAPDLDLRHVATQTGRPLAAVQEEFSSMLAMKLLVGAYVDKATGYLVLSKTHDYKFMKTAPSAATARQLPLKEVNCEQCGALNQVEEGFMKQCGQCGHLLVDD